ncbi:MAG: hypothetical protein SGJ19_12045 [Planctomycetia bacterium]|nr:hypothetical protein [Planctomycetia bacterium]
MIIQDAAQQPRQFTSCRPTVLTDILQEDVPTPTRSANEGELTLLLSATSR